MIVEIKTPNQGSQSDLWKSVERNILPDHYMAQVQHQLFVMEFFAGGWGDVPDIEVGSEQWLAIRRTLKMASETPSLLGLSPWKPKTPLQLYKVKTGEDTVAVNQAMRDGNKFEARARELLERDLDNSFPPAFMTGDDYFAASLDGWDGDHDVTAVFCVYCKHNDCIVHMPVELDGDWRERIVKAWDKFWPSYIASVPPSPIDGDYQKVKNNDLEEWLYLHEQYREFSEIAKNADDAKKSLKEKLSKLVNNKSSAGIGYQYTVFHKKGSIDYKKIVDEHLSLTDQELEQYRKPSSTQNRISGTGENNND